MKQSTCFHCGDLSNSTTVHDENKTFCSQGCNTVYEIFSENDLTCYYDLQSAPGSTPKDILGKYDFLSQPNII